MFFYIIELQNVEPSSLVENIDPINKPGSIWVKMSYFACRYLDHNAKLYWDAEDRIEEDGLNTSRYKDRELDRKTDKQIEKQRQGKIERERKKEI